MRELAEVLLHSSHWDVDNLPERLRLMLGALVLAATVLGAMVAGWLSARWAGRRAARPGHEAGREPLVGRFRLGLRMLLATIGLYAAVELFPLPPRAESRLTSILFIVGAFLAARLTIHVLLLLLTTSANRFAPVERDRLEREYVPIASKVITVVVSLVLLSVVLRHFGQDVTSVVAALGIGSLAIGLAAQQTLGNMIAGLTLLFDRPFRVGDRIRLASGESGVVLEIGVRSTRLLLGDRNLLIVPNTELVNSRVVNYAFPSPSERGEVRVTVSYESDIDRATVVLADIAAADERILKQPPPLVRVLALAPLGVELALGFDVASHADTLAVEQSVRRQILKRFAAEKIEIPHLRPENLPLSPR